MAEMISKTHEGKHYFNLGQAAKVIGCGRNRMAGRLHRAGFQVKKIGPGKYISAHEIAAFMAMERIAPIDNTSKGS